MRHLSVNSEKLLSRVSLVFLMRCRATATASSLPRRKDLFELHILSDMLIKTSNPSQSSLDLFGRYRRGVVHRRRIAVVSPDAFFRPSSEEATVSQEPISVMKLGYHDLDASGSENVEYSSLLEFVIMLKKLDRELHLDGLHQILG